MTPVPAAPFKKTQLVGSPAFWVVARSVKTASGIVRTRSPDLAVDDLHVEDDAAARSARGPEWAH